MTILMTLLIAGVIFYIASNTSEKKEIKKLTKEIHIQEQKIMADITHDIQIAEAEAKINELMKRIK